ncbi:hypothetical protein HOP52_06760 [Halomonas campisalis]|uniref:Uncharacterized protein n=1 Tax=Billgrantia campisalis TaxID=74661 RepID=A0ABS9P8Q0_9GAMM|nr:hypothetical protein [Halomonas campisalis]MCG6657465.1 hypothetical protein [Halomonas campisalis]MDR5863189.1 hypothetical protein [Halomonas campisalis]
MLSTCLAQMGFLGSIMPIAMLTLLGLGIAALAKYLFTSRHTFRDLPEARS